mmetsp:Transcript_21274/g.46184  ORF Transcript_21274/g.46184 Transcript_21274/m.46184 type:complete len:80 (-) Transcript_21274:241-480(-)
MGAALCLMPCKLLYAKRLRVYLQRAEEMPLSWTRLNLHENDVLSSMGLACQLFSLRPQFVLVSQQVKGIRCLSDATIPA